jgi:hypothetical protein
MQDSIDLRLRARELRQSARDMRQRARDLRVIAHRCTDPGLKQELLQVADEIAAGALDREPADRQRAKGTSMTDFVTSRSRQA